MLNKKLLVFCVVVVALIFVFMTAMAQISEVSPKDMTAGIFLMILYVVLLVSYLSRIALVFFGVFAVYKLLKERVNLGNTSR